MYSVSICEETMLYILFSFPISLNALSILLFVMSIRGCFSHHLRRLVSQEPVADYVKPLLSKRVMRKVKSDDDAMSIEVPLILNVNHRISLFSTTPIFLFHPPSPQPIGIPSLTLVFYQRSLKRRNRVWR